jgi:hypothetical protein
MLSSRHIANAKCRFMGLSTALMRRINADDFHCADLWAGTVTPTTALTARHIVNKLCRI